MVKRVGAADTAKPLCWSRVPEGVQRDLTYYPARQACRPGRHTTRVFYVVAPRCSAGNIPIDYADMKNEELVSWSDGINRGFALTRNACVLQALNELEMHTNEERNNMPGIRGRLRVRPGVAAIATAEAPPKQTLPPKRKAAIDKPHPNKKQKQRKMGKNRFVIQSDSESIDQVDQSDQVGEYSASDYTSRSSWLADDDSEIESLSSNESHGCYGDTKPRRRAADDVHYKIGKFLNPSRDDDAVCQAQAHIDALVESIKITRLSLQDFKFYIHWGENQEHRCVEPRKGICQACQLKRRLSHVVSASEPAPATTRHQLVLGVVCYGKIQVCRDMYTWFAQNLKAVQSSAREEWVEIYDRYMDVLENTGIYATED